MVLYHARMRMVVSRLSVDDARRLNRAQKNAIRFTASGRRGVSEFFSRNAYFSLTPREMTHYRCRPK